MRKLFAGMFVILGLVILMGTGVLCFRALNMPAKLLGTVETAQECTEQWAEAVTAGDYAAAGKRMYGQPSLETSDVSAYAVGEILWEAYQENLRLAFSGECRAMDSGIAREAKVTALDISAVMKEVKVRINPTLGTRAESAEDKNLVFDEDNAYREEFVMKTLCDVTRQILEEEPPVLQRTIMLQLVFEDGQWWILPEQELIRLLSGIPGKGA